MLPNIPRPPSRGTPHKNASTLKRSRVSGSAWHPDAFVIFSRTRTLGSTGKSHTVFFANTLRSLNLLSVDALTA